MQTCWRWRRSSGRWQRMLGAKVLYPPQFGASLKSLDASAAEKMPGVKVVHDGNFVAVAAPAPDVAQQAVAALKAEWNPVTAETDSQHVFEYFKQNGGSGASAGLTPYTVAYIAHVPLEPRAAVAEWSGDKLTVWTGSQRPFGVREELAAAFRIPPERVRVIVPDTGSGYGGKHTGETALEAARLAKAAEKPVKVVWTREEEFTWAYSPPAGVIDIDATVMKDGLVTRWEFHNYNSGGSALRDRKSTRLNSSHIPLSRMPSS